MLGMHDIGFLPISDMPIFFQLILADTDVDTDIFPLVWKQHQVSPVQEIISKIFVILVSFNKNLFIRIK